MSVISASSSSSSSVSSSAVSAANDLAVVESSVELAGIEVLTRAMGAGVAA